MITQKILARTDSLKLDKIISRYGEDSMRQVVFIIVRPDPESEEFIPITIPEDAVGSFRILKPSGNFVIVPMNKSVLSTGETAFDVVIPASANTAKGSGYYDIRITSETDKYYFTAQGDFLIDDNIISDEVLEDVSEVNGLVFPDDFLTVENNFAQIEDTVISSSSVWSSSKTNDAIEEAIEGIDIPSPIISYSSTPTQIGTWLDGRTPIYRIVIPKAIYIQGNSSVSEVINELPTKAVILDVAMVARVSGNNWYRCIIRPAVSYDTGGSHGMNFYYANNQPKALWQSTHIIIDYIEEV